MKLGTRIALGFGAVLAIMALLGGTAVLNMRSVGQDTDMLAAEYVPEVNVSNEAERYVHQAVYEMARYTYTERDDYLKLTRENIAKLEQSLKSGLELAHRSPHLKQLGTNTEAAQAGLANYLKLVEETVADNTAIGETRRALDKAAQQLVDACEAYLTSQNDRLSKDIEAGAQADQLKNLLRKNVLINDIVDRCNGARIAFFRAQATRDPAVIDTGVKAFEQVAAMFDEIRKLTTQEADLKAIDDARGAADTYKAGMIQIAASMRELQGTDDRRRDAAVAVLDKAKAGAAAGVADTQSIANEAAGRLSTASSMVIAGIFVALLIGAACGWVITRSVTRTISRIVAGLTEGAEQVNDAASQVATSSQHLAEGASEQASSLEETSSALEEMAAMTRTNAANAAEADTLASKAQDAAHGGDQSMARLNEAMSGINESSEKIRKIIKVIEEISFQTNLLALNAAVEAARAGEHGKGFAVVADEVRNLAQRAAQAAKETTTLIEDAVGRSQQGTQVAGELGKALGTIVADVSKVSGLIDGIAKASAEQAAGVDQVNTAVSQMDKVTQSNASGAEESAAAAEELSAQAQAVRSLVLELSGLFGGKAAGAARSPSATAPPRRTSLSSTSPAGAKAAKPTAAAKWGEGLASEQDMQDF